MMAEYILLLPLIAAVITGFLSKKISKNIAGLFNSTMLIIASILSMLVFYKVAIQGNTLKVVLFDWIDIGQETVKWTIFVDSLTAIMLVVVTTISSIVHVYSIGYMSDDKNMPRFMSYLSLFTFFMLMLVTSDNLIQLFFGWEGVGLCSYLLIGFWYEKESACKAAMKAFIVNRVGDIFFALGIFSIYLVFNSVMFDSIFEQVANLKDLKVWILGTHFEAMNFICVLLFIGCMGKSAQIGLHTWLPDAMEGPTPVSALIHAATMVTAGVFLVARCSPLFEYAPFARDMVILVGAVTCVFAATIALTQNDIKRIVAYSTCSQLGYMFFACGVSAYPAAIFHLFTHAFFKALLFLGAGSVIHAMSGEQNIQKMGKLWKKIPFTYIMMWVGSLALCGIWPFSGYYSKDAIIEAAYANGTELGEYAYSMGIFAAACTAFYSFRLIFVVFHGKNNVDKEVEKHIHEPSLLMSVPLTLLAIGAIFAGFIGENNLHILDPNLSFWHNSLMILPEHDVLNKLHDLDISVKITPTLVAVIGIAVAYWFYIKDRSIPQILFQKYQWIHAVIYNKYYFDEMYDIFIVNNVKRLANFLTVIVENKYIDGFGPNGLARFINKLSSYAGKLQSGYVYHYALVMLLGFVALFSWYLFNFI